MNRGPLLATIDTTKPVDLEEFLKVVKTIDSFWLTVAKLPREGDL
jgi:hypothetical protein